MRTRSFLAILGATLTTQPSLYPDTTVVHHERRHDYGNSAQALIDEWRNLRIGANIAAHFFEISEKPFARTPRAGDPRQSQFHEQSFVDAAAFFRRAGGEVAVGSANAADLSVISEDAKLWLRVLRQQQRGRWYRDRKALFAQAVEALRIITNEDGQIGNACDWRPLEIHRYDIIARRGAEIEVEVQIDNPNDVDSPVAPLWFWFLLGAPSVIWPKKKSIPAYTRTKMKFTLKFAKGELEVRFARSNETRGH